ncbi:hypothetical protein [Thermomonospora cellulosilytica]|uniref:Uncharacterized protein n=1 Tax=Thermomonospora cellulosilytica TaxID=1411118 RepID=A0A7W3N4A9_9ACTN|nr:hypothetical protein [Thermomonospora cellulosilytica]MBA9007242.1 hypothetical protein [Thermomonospora cellulosilytica]
MSFLRYSKRAHKTPVKHGTVMKRYKIMRGPVEFRLPKDATPDEVRQAQEYCDYANKALKEGKLSPTGRVKVSGKLKDDKEDAAERERQRAEAAGNPYGPRVAAHLPDTTWVGVPEPPGWGRHTNRINSVLGSQSGLYPEGYRPTEFRIET